MRGATFYQRHLLLDKHADEQRVRVDTLAERVQTLGGIAVGDPRHVAEFTRVPRPPDGCEEVPSSPMSSVPGSSRRGSSLSTSSTPPSSASKHAGEDVDMCGSVYRWERSATARRRGNMATEPFASPSAREYDFF